MLPACRPINQGEVFARIKKWEPGAADKAIAEIKREKPNFTWKAARGPTTSAG